MPRHVVFGFGDEGISKVMRDSEDLFDDIPAADAADQLRPVIDPGLDEEASAEPPTEPPLEAAAADWQEQLEIVDVDPEETFRND
jgi:hypothetical protein